MFRAHETTKVARVGVTGDVHHLSISSMCGVTLHMNMHIIHARRAYECSGLQSVKAVSMR